MESKRFTKNDNGFICKNCGKEVDANAVACPGCGCVPTNGNKFCPNCGARVVKEEA